MTRWQLTDEERANIACIERVEDAYGTTLTGQAHARYECRWWNTGRY